MNYVKNPNFPSNSITVAAVSSEAEDVISALQSAKIAVVPVEPNENLPTGIASHADLQILHLGGNSVLTASCSKNSTDMLNMLGFEIKNTETELDLEYPEDCLINAEIIGKNIIVNPDIIDKKLMEFA
ncbi:MAG: hypothetical protein IKD39_07265, partial [Oscillospiraceae bacterium]|nr:hypothetical protein [Oscillospiraceae bacterium]